MFYLACTRFNNITYDENLRYRNKHNEPVIYGSTLKIRDIYASGIFMFIVEMNNEKNRIEGIGLIKNSLVYDKRHKIYKSNDEYNRYIYRGKYWLNREQINEFEPELLEIFDNILFKGKSHLKCRIGITVITDKLFLRWNYDQNIVKNMVKQTFIHYFRNKVDEELVEQEVVDESVIYEDKKEEYFEIIPKKRKRKEELNNKKI